MSRPADRARRRVRIGRRTKLLSALGTGLLSLTLAAELSAQEVPFNSAPAATTAPALDNPTVGATAEGVPPGGPSGDVQTIPDARGKMKFPAPPGPGQQCEKGHMVGTCCIGRCLLGEDGKPGRCLQRLGALLVIGPELDGWQLLDCHYYEMTYPVNPWYCDPRDTRVYSAHGIGAPMTVPLAPTVTQQYNYGWGIPSSRITRISRVAENPNANPYAVPPMTGRPYPH
jgi:hypothetical protein